MSPGGTPPHTRIGIKTECLLRRWAGFSAGVAILPGFIAAGRQIGAVIAPSGSHPFETRPWSFIDHHGHLPGDPTQNEKSRSMAETRVFVCFHTNDLSYVNTLVAWDKDKEFDFVFEDSLPKVAFHSEAGKQVKSELTEKIKSGTHLLCIVGKDVGNNDWINWQVQTASVTGRKVIAVRLNSRNKSPAALLNFGSTQATSFTFDAIKKAIDGAEATSAVMPPLPEGASRFDNL